MVGLLVDNEMLDYGERIAQVWPEYCAGGKEDGTLAHLMRHELGLPLLSSSLNPLDFSLDNIKYRRNILCGVQYSCVKEQLTGGSGGEGELRLAPGL